MYSFLLMLIQLMCQYDYSGYFTVQLILTITSFDFTNVFVNAEINVKINKCC